MRVGACEGGDKMGWRCGSIAGAMAIVASAAHAQGLQCQTTAGEVCQASGCRQVRIFEVKHYPAEAHFQLTVRSADPQHPSVLLQARDTLLEANTNLDTSAWNTSFQSSSSGLPLPLDHGFAYQAANLNIGSYEACKALAGVPDAKGPVFLDNRLAVAWDGGQAQCTSRVVCFP
jgi:hypothetical protein